MTVSYTHLSVVRASWTDVFLLTLIEMGLFAAAVGAGGIMELLERLCAVSYTHLCDLSTPKNDGTFNVYEDIRAKLIQSGVPEEEIRPGLD